MKQLLINLPVKDINRSQIFFEKIGFVFNKELTDENAVCFNILNNSDNIVLALLPEEHFKSAINNKVADAMTTNEMLLSVGLENSSEVDKMFSKAINASAREIAKPTDYGTIYGATFADIDGHQWNLYYMKSK